MSYASNKISEGVGDSIKQSSDHALRKQAEWLDKKDFREIVTKSNNFKGTDEEFEENYVNMMYPSLNPSNSWKNNSVVQERIKNSIHWRAIFDEMKESRK